MGLITNNFTKVLMVSSITATLFIGCASVTKNENNMKKDQTLESIKLEAKKAIKTVGGALKMHLGKEMKSGGPAKAAGFCSNSASSIANIASKTLPEGVSVKRITTKPRNSKSEATVAQLKVLHELEELNKQGKLPAMMVKKISNNHYQVYKPLKIESKCLHCHGDNTNINKKAYNIIKEKYPNDKAINYKLNELRGAFLVDIVK